MEDRTLLLTRIVWSGDPETFSREYTTLSVVYILTDGNVAKSVGLLPAPSRRSIIN